MAEEGGAPAAECLGPLATSAIARIVLTYAGFSALWILLSDRVLASLLPDRDWFALVSVLKGWLFVLVTSLLLLVLLGRLRGARPASARAGRAATLAGLKFAPLALIVLVTAGVSVAYTLVRHRDAEVARLQAIADLKVALISIWLADREEQAAFFRSDESLTEEFHRWHGAGDAAAGERLRARLARMRSDRGFSELMLLDPDGHYLWSTAEASGSPAPALEAAAGRSARDGRVIRLGPYLDDAGRPRLDFVAAFPPSLGAAPVIVFGTDPSHWLQAALQASPAPSASGETLLFRREGEAVVFLNQLRHRPDSLLRLTAGMDQEGLLAAQILRGEAGLGEPLAGRDYRGVPVIGVAHAVPGTNWFLVAKMDLAELLQESAADILWIALASLLALALARIGTRLLHQREQLLLARGVQQSQTEKLRALSLLAAIADASEDPIFAKDHAGRYTLCNRAASRFVGKSVDEVLGRDDRALFPAGQAAAVMAKDRELIADNRMQTVEETLTTAEGPRFFLTTKGPLRDADGKVLGIFGIARDVTERMRAEAALRESEGRFRALVEQAVAGIYIMQDGLFRYVNPGFARILGYDSPEAVMGRLTVSEFAAPEDRAWVGACVRGRLEAKVAEGRSTITARRRDGSRVEVELHGGTFDYQGRPAVIGLLLDASSRKASEEALRKQAEELARRNAELERFNRAVVGRELDMLALKQQVNTLSRALGLDPPFILSFVDTLAPVPEDPA